MTTAAAADRPPALRSPQSEAGVWVVILAGIGLVGYGLLFLIRNFTGFIELGLTPRHVGGTRDQLAAANMQFYHYTGHLQVAVAGFIIAVGVAVILLAWNGIRTGQRWAAWAAFLVPAIGVAIAVPLHYSYGLATMGHLGVIYLDAVILLVGTILSLRAMAGPAEARAA